jgi:hypothetical protein
LISMCTAVPRNYPHPPACGLIYEDVIGQPT